MRGPDEQQLEQATVAEHSTEVPVDREAIGEPVAVSSSSTEANFSPPASFGSDLSDFYRGLVDGVDVGIAAMDADFNIVAINRKQALAFDGTGGGLLGKKCYAVYWGRTEPCEHCPGARSMAERKPCEVQVAGKDANGCPVDVCLRASPLFSRSGEVVGFVEVVDDVSKRVADERELKRINRLYAALSELNRTVARIQTREELYREVCQIAAKKAGFKTAWIGSADKETHAIRPVGRAGDCLEYVDRIKVRSDDSPEGQGPMGICIRTGEPSVFNDFLADPRAAAWHAMAGEYGLRAAAALPIFFRGEIFGAIGVYGEEPNIFRDKEVALLEEFAAAISVAMESMDREEKRRQAEELAQVEASRLKFLFDLSQTTDQMAMDIPKHATENAIQLTGSTIGYFAFVDEDLATLTMHYWSQSAMAACAVADKPIVYALPKTGLWGEAVRQRKPIITNDYLAPHPGKKGTPLGHVPIVRHMNVPVFDHGRIVAVAGVGNKSTDYTEEDAHLLTLFMGSMWRILCRKRAEEQLKEYAAELEKTNQALEEAKLAAEAANRTKNEFLANMSHEIRTPITAILGFSDLLAAGESPPEERKNFLDGIQRNGRSLLEMINAILELSRFETEQPLPDKKEFAVRPLIDDIVANATILARKKGLRLEVNCEHPIPETLCTDPARVRQILTTLVGNAVKFTERGEVRILLRSIPGDGDTVKMQFSVADTGVGIPREKIAELFQPFMQADGSASRRFGGAGLGLALSACLAKAMGGNLEVVSELGKGSIFTLTINAGPRRDLRMAQPPHSATPPQQMPLSDQSDVLPPRLLLAEDDEDIQTIMRLLLRKLKLEVSVANDGKIACEMAAQSRAENRPYDLIFMDIQMPRMDGYEATQWLRQHGWRGAIVALTAHALVGDRERCLAAGCDDYLAKPVFISALRNILEHHLGYVVPDPEPVLRHTGEMTNDYSGAVATLQVG